MRVIDVGVSSQEGGIVELCVTITLPSGKRLQASFYGASVEGAADDAYGWFLSAHGDGTLPVPPVGILAAVSDQILQLREQQATRLLVLRMRETARRQQQWSAP